MLMTVSSYQMRELCLLIDMLYLENIRSYSDTRFRIRKEGKVTNKIAD